MSHLFHGDRVKLICCCGMKKPITSTYFCRYCLRIRCVNCVSDEIDTMFCPNCLEVMPSTEARLKQNRCTSCFDCPSCNHALSSRAATVKTFDVGNPDVVSTKKVYYLCCTSCRWSTRDVGMADQTTAAGSWGEKHYPEAKRIQDIMEYYLGVAQREKLEFEKKKKKKTVPFYPAWSEKYSLSTMYSSKSLSSTSPHVSLKEVLPTSSEAVDSIGFESSEYTVPLDLTSVTTLEQRFLSSIFQPEKSSELIPLHKLIVCKKSHRCRVCDHILSKPEYNPSSIKFKIQLGAYFHVPEIRILKEVLLKKGEPSKFQLTVCNPTPHAMLFSFLPFSTDPTELQPRFDFKDEKGISRESISDLSKEDTATIIDLDELELTADVTLPSSQIILSAKDETVEYGETADTSEIHKNNPDVITWGRANKVAVNITVTPSVASGEAVIAFLLRYEYTNTVATAPNLRTVTLTIPIIVNCGRITST